MHFLFFRNFFLISVGEPTDRFQLLRALLLCSINQCRTKSSEDFNATSVKAWTTFSPILSPADAVRMATLRAPSVIRRRACCAPY